MALTKRVESCPGKSCLFFAPRSIAGPGDIDMDQVKPDLFQTEETDYEHPDKHL